MADVESILTTEQRKQRLIVIVAILGISIGALAQRNQRALLIPATPALTGATAFAAIAPPAQVAALPTVGGTVRPLARRAAPIRRVALGGPVADDLGPIAGTGPTPTTDPVGTPGPTPLSETAATGGETTLALNDPSVFPGLGSPTLATTGGLDGGPGAVPEPATWLIMVFGIGGIGAMLRRRRDAADRTAVLGATGEAAGA